MSTGLIARLHMPTFRAELATNQDVKDPVFLSLTISLVALVVSVLPSRFPSYQSMNTDRHFATRSDMAEYCWTVCLQLRSARYWDQISQRKWAISYALCMSAFQLGQNNQGRMFEAEAMQTARLLGVHLVSEYTGLNPVETQLRKKAFWLQFFGSM
ncbi:hypothetical protein F5X68DRAFT_231964 [Plectosphaerella plurivora]|uniref:Transcription factor domain-containing protein n=1 Tax=Plectosphaerella plurivora TaxID=936078 RepID=A0A9P9AC55_9PEZI|nr:hypothetical protein F5X68DRAFT_231964 [Plectosphaerella plurivora]